MRLRSLAEKIMQRNEMNLPHDRIRRMFWTNLPLCCLRSDRAGCESIAGFVHLQCAAVELS
jgi:hypothetical protein